MSKFKLKPNHKLWDKLVDRYGDEPSSCTIEGRYIVIKYIEPYDYEDVHKVDFRSQTISTNILSEVFVYWTVQEVLDLFDYLSTLHIVALHQESIRKMEARDE